MTVAIEIYKQAYFIKTLFKWEAVDYDFFHDASWIYDINYIVKENIYLNFNRFKHYHYI